jgi:sortase A
MDTVAGVTEPFPAAQANGQGTGPAAAPNGRADASDGPAAASDSTAATRKAPSTFSAQPPAAAGPGPAARPVLHSVGVALTLLGVFILGFLAYLYGFSGIGEARAQTTLYPTLRIELGNQVAPLGATTPGAPVAILTIPSIGIADMIVVEGTTPENLALGPGHLRNTPMPGQAGVAEIFGRRATFGAPFSRLLQLRSGDKITVTTGQGHASYTVVARGDSTHLVEDPAPNRLLLVTACSAYAPTAYCYLDADLTSAAQQNPGGLPLITQAETPLSGDSGALVLTLIWAMALLAVSAAGTIAAARWSPRLAYLAAMPLALAVLWNLYQSLAALLPNVY